MDKLPNVLDIALAALIDEQNVIQLNIHSNVNIVNVTMTFAMSGYVAAQSPMPQPQVNSARNKSPAQQQRDDSRAMVWSQSTTETNCEYYKPATVAEHNTTDIIDIVQVRDISVSNIELSACAPSYVPQSVSKPGQTSEVAHSTVIENDPKPEWKTPGHIDPVVVEMNNHVENKPQHTHKWNLRNNNIKIDNSEDFQKVIFDHRSVVNHTTIRGLTKCGTIVNFETNKHSDFFRVLEKDEDNVEYNESLSVINMFSDCRNIFCNI